MLDLSLRGSPFLNNENSLPQIVEMNGEDCGGCDQLTGNVGKSGGWFFVVSVVVVMVLLSASPVLGAIVQDSQSGNSPIKHVIIIMEENHTFDNYFGTYPGVNGLNGSTSQPLYASAPPTVFPFHLRGLTLSQDFCHNWTCAHRAYDNGKLDGFVAAAGSNLTMGYFDYNQIPYYWDYASQYVLLDNFYSSVMGPSLPNHLYLIAGQSGGFTGSSTGGRIDFTSGLVYNSTFYSKPIFEELQAQNISWRYYAGGYSALNNWNPVPAFSAFRSNSAWAKNLEDPSNFAADVKSGQLASVVWMMPRLDNESEHAPYDVSVGEHIVVRAINALMQSSYWNSTAIFITFDDYGGWYDHVPPPQVDGLGYGFRVPCLVISPYAKQGLIDHVQADFASLLKFVETIYSLQPLSTRDSDASNLMEAFDFAQSPRAPLILPGPFVPDHYPLVPGSGQTTTTTATTTRTSTTVTTTPRSSTTVTPKSGFQAGAAYLIPSVAIGAFVLAVLALSVIMRRARTKQVEAPPL